MKKQVLIAFAVGLCLTVNIWAQVPSYVPTNGLVGYWPFNGNANDESGNGNNGTVNGATLTTDRFGVVNKAHDFDGNDIINLGLINLSQYNQMSMNVWVYPTSFNTGFWWDIDIMRQQGTENVDYLLAFQNFGTILSFGLGFQGGGYSELDIPITSANFLNTWHNIIAVYDGSQKRVYLDGNLIGSENVTGYISYSTTNAGSCIGGIGNGEYFAGKLDECTIWSQALTQQEILALYQGCNLSMLINSQTTQINQNIQFTTSSLNNTSYQWQNNPLNNGWQNVPSNATYSGGNTNTLTVNNVQLSNHNQPFRLIANAGNCSDTSNVATIQIADTCITNVTIYDTLLTTVTDTLIINTTLSLPAPNNENTILIYPNPASDHVTIDNGNFAAMAGYSIKIENNAGQQVFQNAINQAQFYVDLSTWTGNGLYFVHLIDAQGNTVTVRKIVLQ
jgi:hypothetical protein